MIKGSTPTFSITLPFDTSLIEKARVSFGQDFKELVCKKETECRMEGTVINCELSQEETLEFNHIRPVQVQVKVKMTSGKVILTKPMETDAEYCLCKEVL